MQSYNSSLAARKKINKRTKKVNLGIYKTVEPYLYILPAMFIFIAFTFYPFIKTIYLSLNATNPQGQVSYFVGLENYINQFKSSSFINSLIVTAKFAVLTVFPSIFLGFITAILGNTRIKGIGIFRTLYALPLAISAAAASIVWMFLFHPSIGLINYILESEIGWLTDPTWGLLSVVIVTVWMNIGINFVFMIGGLQSISQDLYESASIDGAGAFRKHWSITIPSLGPTLFFLLVINVINTFQAFGQIKIMTSGGPGEATNALVFSIYREAFFNNRFGVASAQSIVLFIILLILTLLQFKLEKKVNY